jgi:hypothetical protein
MTKSSTVKSGEFIKLAPNPKKKDTKDFKDPRDPGA